MHHGEFRSYRGSRLVNEFVLRFFSVNFTDTFKTGKSLFYIFFKLVFVTDQHQVIMRLEDRTENDTSPVPVSTNVDDRTEQPVVDQANQKSKNPSKKEPKRERGNPLCYDIPEWLQEFREILVDDEIPERGDSHASSSHEVSLEPTFIKRSADLGKHSVDTHFPKDRNCEICQRTNSTRAPCRRRNGGAVLRAENFW